MRGILAVVDADQIAETDRLRLRSHHRAGRPGPRRARRWIGRREGSPGGQVGQSLAQIVWQIAHPATRLN